MKIKRKNGFTVVELVIIIAVIAILAAVLIPTFSSIVKKASESTDIQTVRNLNTAIKIDAVHHNSMHDALAAAKANGFAVEQVRSIGSGGDNFVAWDSVNDRFVIIKKVDGGNDKFIFPSPEGEQEGEVKDTDKVAYFVFYDNVPEEQTYSIYLDGNNKTESVSVSVGFDVGENYGIKSVEYEYKENVDNRNIILRTNNTGTDLSVEDKTNSTIAHFGDSGNQTINSGALSFHEYGGALKATITGGHYVAEGGSIVVVLDASASERGVIVDLESGSVQGTVKNTNTQNAVTINGKPGAKTISFVANKENNNLKATFATPPTYTNTTDVGGESDDLYITGVGEEKRYANTESHDHNFITVSGSNIKVCTICGTYEYTVISVNNDGEKSENNYEATINSDGSSNVVNTSTDHNHAYGNPEWTWKEDNSGATAKFTCTADDCSYTVTVIAPNGTNTISGPDTVNPTCTTAGSTTYTADITFNDTHYQNSKVIPIAIDQDAHSWGEPEWTWTDDGNGGYTATATFTCTINQEHTHIIENVTATSAEGTGDHDGQTVYTATVNFNNENYNDYKYVTNYASFTTVFENTDKYLYRVGNANTVKLGSLFSTTGTPNSANVNVTILAIDNSGVTGAFTKNSTTWSDGTIQFAGTGPVAVTIKEGEGEGYTLNLEVISAKNVTAYSELSNANCVLLNDITMSSGANYYLNGNHTLYGNGFTFDVKNALHVRSTNQNISNNYVICLSNANLDNIKIIGKVYTDYGIQATKDDWNFPCVLADGQECAITNSYIANCASPIRVRANNLLIKNTTLKGGSFCNLDIRGGTVTVDGLTTINQVANNDVADDDTIIVGLGIVFNNDGPDAQTQLIIEGDGLTQYNWGANNQGSYAVSSAKSVFNNMFNINTKFLYTDTNSVKWVNTGILSLSSAVGDNNITDISEYDGQGVSLLGYSGYLYTSLASAPVSASEYSPDSQYAVAPNYSFEYPTTSGNKNYVAKTDGSDDYCYWDSTTSTILIGFTEGSSFSFNPNILTITKNGNSITPTVSIDGGSYQSVNNNITIDTSGSHTLTFKYVDQYNYQNNLDTYSQTYTKVVKITVTVAKKSINPASFDFNGKGYKTVTANNTTYVMPNVNATVTNSIGSKTIGGQTIYYPIVCTYYSTSQTGSLTKTPTDSQVSGNSMYAWMPIFDGVVTITDYTNTNDSITYGGSTKTLADGKLECVHDFSKTSGDPLYEAIRWTSGTKPTEENAKPVTNNNKIYFRSIDASNNARTRATHVLEYAYTDTAGNIYHYFVGYIFPDKSESSCFAAGTLITLADGTQKPVEQITSEDRLLTWDFVNGRYVSSDVFCVTNHGIDTYPVTRLVFSDGSEVKLISEHGLFDADTNKFVNITSENANEYIGHKFVKFDAENGTRKVELISAETTLETTSAYSIIAVEHLDVIANEFWTLDPSIYFLLPFGIDSEYRFNSDEMSNDIETYGLMEYDEFKQYAPFMTEEQFIAGSGKYIKIALGKGIITMDEIMNFAKRILVDQDYIV